MSAFQTSLRVRYAETDAQGIAFNANYLTWCDVAVTEYFRGCGIPYAQFVQTAGVDFHVVRAEIDFKKPARFDDELEIQVRGQTRGARILWTVEMRRTESLLCAVLLEYAVIDTKTRRPTRLPEQWQQTLGLESA
jgi:acyl-CoA thioester hydrolase